MREPTNVVGINGETNLHGHHEFKLGDLVEFKPAEGLNLSGWLGLRLRISALYWDCDGSPCYSLGIYGQGEEGEFHSQHLLDYIQGDEIQFVNSEGVIEN